MYDQKSSWFTAYILTPPGAHNYFGIRNVANLFSHSPKRKISIWPHETNYSYILTRFVATARFPAWLCKARDLNWRLRKSVARDRYTSWGSRSFLQNLPLQIRYLNTKLRRYAVLDYESLGLKAMADYLASRLLFHFICGKKRSGNETRRALIAILLFIYLQHRDYKLCLAFTPFQTSIQHKIPSYRTHTKYRIKRHKGE